MLTGLELTFMGLTVSNSGLFSTPGFIVSPVGKRGMGAKKKKKEEEGKEGKREWKRKGRKEEGRERDRRQDKKEF